MDEPLVEILTPEEPVVEETPAPSPDPAPLEPADEDVVLTVVPLEPALPPEPPIAETAVLETDHGRTLVHLPDWLASKQATLLLQGVSWYHKTEDADGRWVYRKD